MTLFNTTQVKNMTYTFSEEQYLKMIALDSEERWKAFDAEQKKWEKALDERGCFYRTYLAGTDNTGHPYLARKIQIYDKKCFGSPIDDKVPVADRVFNGECMEYEKFFSRLEEFLKQKDKEDGN